MPATFTHLTTLPNHAYSCLQPRRRVPHAPDDDADTIVKTRTVCN